MTNIVEIKQSSALKAQCPWIMNNLLELWCENFQFYGTESVTSHVSKIHLRDSYTPISKQPLPLWFSNYNSVFLTSPICSCCCRSKTSRHGNAMWSSKMSVFWDVVPHSLIEVHWRFRGVYCLHHQGHHLWNVSKLLPDYMMQHPIRKSSSYSPP
jgi:hypothetical protein